MRCSVRVAIVWLAPVLLAVGPEPGTAMEATCVACLDNCCNWAFSAELALYGAYRERRPINEYSWLYWEQYGFPPAPCREVLDDPRAYQRCATRAFDRCYKERCKGCGGGWRSWLPFQSLYSPNHYEDRQRWGVSGSKPVRLYPGQVIIIEKDGSKSEETPKTRGLPSNTSRTPERSVQAEL